MRKRIILSVVAVYSLGLCVVIGLSGCDFSNDHGNGITGIEHPPTVTTDKGKSLIQFDVQFESSKLTKLDTQAREAYLMQRAFAKLDNKKMAEAKHKDMERCVVKIVMLTSLDQYQKPVWGSALEIAELEIDLGKFRKNGKTAAQYQDGEVAEFFVSKQFHHENVKSRPLTVVTIK